MRLNCVENFITIRLSFRKLSCKRPDGRTYRPILEVYSLFEYTKNESGNLSPTRSCDVFHREMLCESQAENSCLFITVTDERVLQKNEIDFFDAF